MNERQEHTADVLGKLTVLGTIVLPMNIICGMWGMNVKVPGQEIDNLNWFWCSKSSLPYFLLVLSLTQYSYCRTMCIRFCVFLDCQKSLQNCVNGQRLLCVLACYNFYSSTDRYPGICFSVMFFDPTCGLWLWFRAQTINGVCILGSFCYLVLYISSLQSG